MKKITLLVAILAAAVLSTTSFAQPNQNSSWDEILRSNLQPKFPKIIFGNISVSINSVCVDGDNLRGGTYQRCTDWNNAEGGSCTSYITEELITPRTYTQEICVDPSGPQGSCRRTEVITSSIPLSYEVPVKKANFELPLFVKTFDIPACVK